MVICDYDYGFLTLVHVKGIKGGEDDMERGCEEGAWKNLRKEERNADYGEMVQLN